MEPTTDRAPIRQNILESLKASRITEELANGLEAGNPFTLDINPDIADTLLAVAGFPAADRSGFLSSTAVEQGQFTGWGRVSPRVGSTAGCR